jgi:hypothetical protein
MYAHVAFFGLTSVTSLAARFVGDAGAAFADFGDAIAVFVVVVVGFGLRADMRTTLRKR